MEGPSAVVPSGATPAIPSLHKVQGEPSTTTQDEAPPAAKMPPAPLDKTARSSTAEEPLSEELHGPVQGYKPYRPIFAWFDRWGALALTLALTQ
jgi:hypothetical protein